MKGNLNVSKEILIILLLNAFFQIKGRLYEHFLVSTNWP